MKISLSRIESATILVITQISQNHFKKYRKKLIFKKKLCKGIFYFTRCTVLHPEACNEFAGPISASLRLRTAQLLSKKCRSDGEALATLRSI